MSRGFSPTGLEKEEPSLPNQVSLSAEVRGSDACKTVLNHRVVQVFSLRKEVVSFIPGRKLSLTTSLFGLSSVEGAPAARFHPLKKCRLNGRKRGQKGPYLREGTPHVRCQKQGYPGSKVGDGDQKRSSSS